MIKTYVMQRKDDSIEVADATMVPCQVKGSAIIDAIDDDGHPIRPKLPNFMYVPGLIKILFSLYKFTRSKTTVPVSNGMLLP